MHKYADFYADLKGKTVRIMLEYFYEDFAASEIGKYLIENDYNLYDFDPEVVRGQDAFLLFGKSRQGIQILKLLPILKEFSKEEAQCLEDWRRQAFSSVFEVTKVFSEGVEITDLIAEVPYKIYSNMHDEDNKKLAQFEGKFIHTNIVPIKGVWFFSGAQVTLPQEEEFIFDTFIRNASPTQLMRNNPEKIKEAIEKQKEHYEQFVKMFGSDKLTVFSYEELEKYAKEFWSDIFGSKKLPLPDRKICNNSIKNTGSLTWVVHPWGGYYILYGYANFINAFKNANQPSFQDLEIVEEFLMDENVPGFIFFEAQKTFPENFNTLMLKTRPVKFLGLDPLKDLNTILDFCKPDWNREYPFIGILNQRFKKYYKKNHKQKPETDQPKRQPKIGRNEPCPCGSGKKYKRCHGK